MDITEKTKQRLLNQLSKTNRKPHAIMETPYWKEKVLRPIGLIWQPVLSYEIYHMASNPDEHKTIEGLNQLVEENEVTRFFKGDWVWYQKI